MQALIWFIIPNLNGSTITNTKNVLRFIIICQYIPRLLLIYPLSAQITKAHGLVTETAWVGAAYNLTLYMLASHVSSYKLTNFFSRFCCLVAKLLMNTTRGLGFGGMLVSSGP